MTSAAADIAHVARTAVVARAGSAQELWWCAGRFRCIRWMCPGGSIFAIIGPNGAGKSTLLNLISGVYQPDSGSLSFNGHDLAGVPSHRRVRLGLARTFQKIRLFKQLSVLDNVIAGFHIHHKIPIWQYVLHGAAFAQDQRRCREEALRLLEFFGMTARLHVLAGALSYGEQRMLELARALATRPQLLLIDEPAAGLNAAEVDVLLDRIRTLRGRARLSYLSSTIWTSS